MKKTVKSLIIAASVAAVAGIGAVSFAAWQGNATERNVTTTTGALETYGITVVTDGLNGKVWVPYNQDLGTYPIENGVNVWDITIKYDGEPTADATYSLKINFAADETTDALESCMYVFKGDTYSAPDKDTTITFEGSTDWQKITGTATAIDGFTAGTDTVIHVIFDSSTVAEMNNNVKLVLTLTH